MAVKWDILDFVSKISVDVFIITRRVSSSCVAPNILHVRNIHINKQLFGAN